MPGALAGLASISLPGLLLAVIFVNAGSAKAQTATAAAAEALFREGKQRLEARDYAHACPKLAESYRLDPATGALLALAVCHEGAGRLASAWAAYAEVAVRSKAEGRGDRERAARERVAALEPRLSMLTISVPAKPEVPGLRLRRDGEDVARAVWGTPVPVDPGPHAIDASAPARKPWHLTVTLGAKPERRSVTIPPLEAERVASTPATASPIGAAGVRRRETTPNPPFPVVSQPGEARSTAPAPPRPTLRTVGLVVAGAGVVALGVGGLFGLRAREKRDAYRSLRDGCQFGCQENKDAVLAGNIATGFTIAGLVVAAAGTTMWLVSRRPKHGSEVALSIEPVIEPVLAAGEWRLGLAGRF